MEDYDELSAGPNEDGQLTVNHDSWNQLPYDLIDFSDRLIFLNMSYNKISEISSIIGSLILLEVRHVFVKFLTPSLV